MQAIPQFLHDHGLNADANERDIRQAYARELKKIDQAANPDQFQYLRNTYERALHWARTRKQLAAKEELQDARQPIEDPDIEQLQNGHTGSPVGEPDQHLLARKMAQKQSEQLRRDDHQPVVDAAQQADSAAQSVLSSMLRQIRQTDCSANDALHAAMTDPLLLPLDASIAFERAVAQHVSQGWLEENGNLLEAAISTFGWDKDGQKLLRLGPVGRHLDLAMTEKASFSQLPLLAQQEVRQLIDKLNQDKKPSDLYLAQNIPKLKAIIHEYPNWLSLMTSKQNVDKWVQWGESPEIQAILKVAPTPTTSRLPRIGSGGMSGGRFAFLLLVVIFNIGRVLTSGSSDHPPPAQRIESPLQFNRNMSDPKEQFELGQDFLFGRDGYAKDVKQAIKYMANSADSGNLDAQRRLGELYSDGRFIPPDPTQAIKWLTLAAAQNDAISQTKLGNLYHYGDKSVKDLEMAKQWYTKAAAKNEPLAAANLASIYLEESKPDCTNGLHYLRQASELGEMWAKSQLGFMLVTGRCNVPKDEAEGVNDIMQAVNAGHPAGQFYRGELFEYGVAGVPKDLQQAAHWYAMAADKLPASKTRLTNLCKKISSVDCPRT